MEPSENVQSKQVGVRLPGHLYRWLRVKVDAGEYSNMAQSVIGELTKAKALEEQRREPAAYAVREEPESDPLLRLVDERLDALRRELHGEIERRR
ncbi:hypothetical protein FGU65_12605 [Methanoculleus sp. FWC-SCC1]|uniref:CopG family transcriptional regulator n=1 Tax=Methanoculleus frigidifontis TaxID=2584085 RepID=A0ABT8MCT0_9EURY|nr:hypothetical protein [Methanoculleus sp. FWC-SCC1]MDN7025711.1 hypothetical protein [Methanoculleus sp. FWC-SCC1]